MADDLDDEWWLSDTKVSETKDIRSKETEKTSTEAHKKRKSHTPDEEVTGSQDATPKKKKKQSSEKAVIEDVKKDMKKKDSTKKKPKRRKISEAVFKEKSRPLHYRDLSQAVTSYFEDQLSTVELDEATLSDSDFFPCHELSVSTADYLETVLPRWNKHVTDMEQSPGAPLMLVVCSAATRAVDIIRDLKTFHYGKCKVAKLFAKHMKVNVTRVTKVQEQAKFLQKSVIHIGVGTPSRIASLLDNESLHLDQTVLILMDWSWRDAKLRRLIDIKDIKLDLMMLLRKHLVPRVKKGRCRFALL